MHKSSCVLQSLNIDDSDFRNTSTIRDFIEATEQNESRTSFTFPLTDAKAIIENTDEDGREIAIRRLTELQINSAQRINVNRAELKKPNDHLVPAREDIQELISKISRGSRHLLKSAEFKRHMCVCHEFVLLVPFQRLGHVVADGGEHDDRSHKMKVRENSSDDETQNERASKKTQVETDSETLLKGGGMIRQLQSGQRLLRST